MKLQELIKKLASENLEERSLDRYLQDFFPEILLKSETLQKAFEISHAEMEEFYRQGYEFYAQDNFKEAITFFHWLSILNPFITKYWMGLGACRQFLKDYENALKAYAVVHLLSNVDPYPHYHAYECYEAMGDKEEGLKALRLADDLASAHSIYQPLRLEIRKILNK